MNWRQAAIAAYERGDREGAVQAFSRALHEGLTTDVARDLAIVYCELGRFDEAASVLEPYLAQQPDDAIAWCALSNALLEQNRGHDALGAALKAIALVPDSWLAWIAVANAQTDIGDFAEASGSLVTAHRLAPQQPEPLANLSALSARTQHVDDAIVAAERAIAVAPNDVAAHVNLAIAHLLRGDNDIGFAEYEWRRRDPSRTAIYTRGSLPAWDGASMPSGTLLLGMEQGMGDFICFSRFVAEARRRVGRIVCEVPPALAPLYRGFPGIDEAYHADDAVTSEAYAAFLPIVSLPHVLQVPPHMPAPYLRADRSRVVSYERLFASLGKPRTIGLVWSGNPAYRMDRHRSLPITELAGLSGVSDVAWVSLQKGAAEDGLDALPFAVHPLGASLENFADTAAAITALDLVITVDTAVAHLVGALGKPAWTLIGFAQHWLWQLDRNDSPWYPSMKLFRQRTPNRWDDVIAEIAQQLRQ